MNERIESIDLIRGIVILMILVININYFALPTIVRYNPEAFGAITSADSWAWFFEYAFVKQRFMTLLAILYGVGIMLFARKYESKNLSATKPFIARSLLLVVFGLIHAYLIWYGDILFAYAIAGVIAYFCRNWSAKWLLAVGFLIAFGITAPDIISAIKSIQNPVETVASWSPSADTQKAMLEQYKGSWLELITPRMNHALYYQTEGFYMFNLWRCGGLMLFGMGLVKLGLFNRNNERLFNYKLWTLGLLIVGLIISIVTSYGYIDSNYSYQYFKGELSLGFYIGSITLGIAYLGLFLWWSESSSMQWLKSILIKAGRMAFTLYIMQSIICGIIFYGFGFDNFGQISRSELTYYTLGIWLLQLIFVMIWFKFFKRGPLEAIWRKGYQLAEPKS